MIMILQYISSHNSLKNGKLGRSISELPAGK